MSRIKLAVCEAPPELRHGSGEWKDLCSRVAGGAPDLMLLNELPFGPWIAAGPALSEALWRESCASHERGVAHLGELGATTVASTRPLELEGSRVNQGFVWTGNRLRGVHTKQYFPEEEGYYEARWFQAGERHFRVEAAGPVRAGFLICTELMFNEHARAMGRAGGQVLLVPRAVGPESLERRLVAMRMAAIVSGCYVLSSNRAGTDSRGQTFGGRAWIVDPEGNVVAETSPATPVVFHEIDTDLVTAAQRGYPCYVKE